MSVKDIKTKDEIIISIGERETAGNSQTVRRGAVRTSNSDRIPKRRKRTGGGIRFFDLCVKNSGAEYYKYFAPELDFSPSDLTYTVGDFEHEEIIAELNESIFSETVANWSNIYRKIAKDSLFEKDILITFERNDDTITGDLSELDEWTENGLILTQAELETLNIGGIFLFDINFNFADVDETEFYKITLSNDINAPAAAFTPSPQMDIFLFPRICAIYGTVNYANGIHTYIDGFGTHTDLVTQTDVLNYIYAVYPRTGYSQVRALFDDFSSYPNHYAIWQVMKNLEGARLVRGVRDFIEAPPYAYFASWQNLPTAQFPFSTVYTPSGINDAAHVYNQNYFASIFGVSDFERLFCVIKKGNQFYYLWRLPLI